MKIIRLKDGTQVSSAPSCAAAFGNFDGVHAGHRALLGEVVRISSESGGLLAPAVWTLRGFKFGDGKKLTSFSEKCSLFRDAGIEYLFTDNYESVRNLSPYEFISNHVIGKMNCFHSVCGYNFSFGSGASGSSDTMRNLMLASGRDSTVVPPYAVGGSVVSSTAIRELLACGRVAEAAAMLDRPYSLSGVVIHGKALGRTLGFPTANILPEKEFAVPERGVYLTRTLLSSEAHTGEDVFFSVTNVGVNPTVDGESRIKCESYILDYTGDLYGKNIKVLFYEKLRDEKKFSSVQELTDAVKKNIEDCLEWSRQF